MYKTKNETLRENITLGITLFAICVLLLMAIADNAKADTTTPTERFISWFLKDHEARKVEALKLVPIIEAESRRANFDPLFLAVIASKESSFKISSRGGIGEIGLFQIHPTGVCSKGQDLTTAEGQVKAAVNCLVLARAHCGNDLVKITTAYASGHCVARTSKTARIVKRRLDYYYEIKRRFE